MNLDTWFRVRVRSRWSASLSSRAWEATTSIKTFGRPVWGKNYHANARMATMPIRFAVAIVKWRTLWIEGVVNGPQVVQESHSREFQ